MSAPASPALPPPLADQIIQALASLGHAVSRQGDVLEKLDERMTVVESLAAGRSVPPPAPPAEPVKDPKASADDFREQMWERTSKKLNGQAVESFLPQTPPQRIAEADTKCKSCRANARYGPSKYCLNCLQAQNRDRCPRCGNVIPEGENGCAACSAEARMLERMTPGQRLPVGEYGTATVEMIAEGFPA